MLCITVIVYNYQSNESWSNEVIKNQLWNLILWASFCEISVPLYGQRLPVERLCYSRFAYLNQTDDKQWLC